MSASKSLASVKPLNVKWQRKSIDIVKAYNLIESTTDDLQEVRESDEIMLRCFVSSDLLRHPGISVIKMATSLCVQYFAALFLRNAIDKG